MIWNNTLGQLSRKTTIYVRGRLGARQSRPERSWTLPSANRYARTLGLALHAVRAHGLAGT